MFEQLISNKKNININCKLDKLEKKELYIKYRTNKIKENRILSFKDVKNKLREEFSFLAILLIKIFLKPRSAIETNI